ncbi:MAG: 2-hydroxyacyl-CoA dehydratase family protein [Nitrospirota bacterium]|nr:2-hydroxyacyl-CoA dehydratase family protein [Nitrospirota bacterium]
MHTERFERVKKSTNLHFTMEADEALRKIEDFPSNPGAMGYFYDLFRSVYANGGSLTHKGTIIGTMCVQVPEELILAAGAVPFRLCNGAHAFDQAGAEFMPAKACSLARATVGMLHINRSVHKERLGMVVVPATCDQKRKAGELLREMGYNVYILEVPSSKNSEEARHYWQNSVKRFTAELQHLTGRKITKKSLGTAINLTNEARRQFRRLYNFRKISPPVVYGKDALLVSNAYFFDDKERWLQALTDLNNELELKALKGESVGNRHAPRILFTGSPPVFPHLKIPLLLEQSGAIVAADEVCSSTRMLYDAVAYDESALYDMIPSVADRYLKPCTCPFLVLNDDRRRRLKDMAGQFAIDGIVYQIFSGCHLYEMEQRTIAKTFADSGIPLLFLETDYSQEDTGQLSTRIEAFLESIKARKRRK